MKSRVWVISMCVSIWVLAACSQGPQGSSNTASGSIAVSHDDALVYAADADRNSVFVIDAKTDAVLAEVAVGRQPEKVLVSREGTVYVTNRMDRSVSVIRRGETAESARIAVGVEPVGLALTGDEKTLYVVNAASLDEPEFGTLMAVSTTTLSIAWELPVGHEPRGIALLDGNRAVITQYKDGELLQVDLAKRQVLSTSTGLFSKLNGTTLGIDTGFGEGRGGVGAPRPLPADAPFGGDTNFSPALVRPRGLEAVAVNPTDSQVYVASLVSTEQTLPTKSDVVDLPSGSPPFDPGRGGGSGYSGGSCGAAAVASPTLLTFDSKLTPDVDDLGACAGNEGNLRPPMSLIGNGAAPIQGPAAIAVDPSGTYVFIANRESNNVAIVSTGNRPNGGSGIGVADRIPFEKASGTVLQLIDVGSGPTGIAVSHSGTQAWAFNAFDHTVSKLSAAGTGGAVVVKKVISLGADVLAPDVVAGRKLFFSATDERMNNPATGISCATCHLEGREDGHVWNTMEGPRQTPSLAGRMTAQTAPFHWNGEFDDLMAFMNTTVTKRMGGSGVSADMERQVAAFIASIPRPDTAVAERTPADVIARGKAAFDKAECGTCHAGATFTDNGFADVGTRVTTGTVIDRVEFNHAKGFNTPSLWGIARSGPYLHDGSAATLRARIEQGKAADLHGKTSALSTDEVSDLVTYLKTL